jgi:hypothetical protein
LLKQALFSWLGLQSQERPVLLHSQIAYGTSPKAGWEKKFSLFISTGNKKFGNSEKGSTFALPNNETRCEG